MVGRACRSNPGVITPGGTPASFLRGARRGRAASHILARSEGSWTPAPSPPTQCQLTSPALLGDGQGGPRSQTQLPRAMRTGVRNLSSQAQLARSLVSLGCLPQKEQEQTTATGDSPLSLLAIPTPGASPGQPGASPKGAGDQPSSWPASPGVQPCSPALCNNQGPWGRGYVCSRFWQSEQMPL